MLCYIRIRQQQQQQQKDTQKIKKNTIPQPKKRGWQVEIQVYSVIPPNSKNTNGVCTRKAKTKKKKKLNLSIQFIHSDTTHTPHTHTHTHT